MEGARPVARSSRKEQLRGGGGERARKALMLVSTMRNQIKTGHKTYTHELCTPENEDGGVSCRTAQNTHSKANGQSSRVRDQSSLLRQNIAASVTSRNIPERSFENCLISAREGSKTLVLAWMCRTQLFFSNSRKLLLYKTHSEERKLFFACTTCPAQR